MIIILENPGFQFNFQIISGKKIKTWEISINFQLHKNFLNNINLFNHIQATFDDIYIIILNEYKK